MKATPLLVQWHNEGTPIYSAHFEPHGKGRLATAGGDNNVRLWKIDSAGEERKVTYLSTLSRHSGTVNVVRWCPKGEMLASAGDDGNILTWVPAEHHEHAAFGDAGLEDKETWRVKNMSRALGTEIYDLAWSPDGVFIISGSMDNTCRIYNAQTGSIVRQIADHTHFIQGVAWDPLNEFVATQSSDRSVHIYTLKTKEGQYTLYSKHEKMNLPSRRISSSSPAPPDFGRASFVAENTSHGMGSPVPSAPGTPQSLALPMNPPPTSHSRRSSFGSSPSMRRSVSPAPSLPLPAVMPSNSPSLHAQGLHAQGLGLRNEKIYAGEDTFSSFFRRLTFAPDGSLLFTPAGQYRMAHPQSHLRSTDDLTNTVYIYTRAGLNKPPVAYLPGHKKPSVAVKCSPIYYSLRQSTSTTKHITVDTSSADPEIMALPEPAVPTKAASHTGMEPPPFTSAPSPSPSMLSAASPKPSESDSTPTPNPPIGPPLAFGLPYRMIYAVATSDAVYVYDTQQQKPLCVVSNLHFATFTDLTWSNDGLTLLMSSSDGFCSCLTFATGELGQVYQGPHPTRVHPTVSAINTSVSSQQTTPNATPVNTAAPPMARQSSSGAFPASPSTFAPARPASPARSMSTSSIASSFMQQNTNDANGNTLLNATPSLSSVGGVTAAHSAPAPGNIPLWTPPETPMANHGGPASGSGHRTHSASSSVSGIGSFAPRRESDVEPSIEGGEVTRKRDATESGAEDSTGPAKKRRVAPTHVSDPST
ncbi:hypothetical protein BLS_002126 [Venturia inaequalis]|uniref:CAF1B/HIR1 beta-propeller domain-containing protein n=1 Tax=Venturia inaequalis TaxID=5025 RepID=A0A8H3YP11_VENIN|nr:hypothetical protein EG328_009977 [Venturia inaequalis]KAE9972085.1 hypothetical protein EG327_009594 [Venturia inaequalis]KAE9976318.1 hypothetical protein BLS_002126 [Venturia inaequalis]RDI76837.1 hypothetical protein Vi05172_g13186 [Venturia inaequalis]